MKKILFLLLCCVTMHSFSQFPELTLNSKQLKPINRSSIKVEVEVFANIAITTFYIDFFNPNNRVLTADLNLSLNENQQVTAYALELNGKMREAVVVEKIKARQVFESVVRRKIDPSIANLTKGNKFNTKVYPIPANGTKSISITVAETLKSSSNNLIYNLGFEKDRKIRNLDITIKIHKKELENFKLSPEFSFEKFDSKEEVFQLKYKRENFTPIADLYFEIPEIRKTELYSTRLENKNFFYARVKAPEIKRYSKENIEQISILWDNSGSAKQRKIKKELEFLKNYLSQLQDLKSIELICFNIDQTKKTFEGTNLITDLLSYIENIKYDGATNFSNLSINPNADESLLFTDGLNTLAKDHLITNQKPLYTISSSSGSNYIFLNQIAESTNAKFLNLNSISIKKALELIRFKTEPITYQFVNSEIMEVYPKYPQVKNGYIEFAGIFKNSNNSIGLKLGNQLIWGSRLQTSLPFNIIKVWARLKSNFLIKNDEPREKIVEFSKKYKILNKYTSLLVLDRLSDYVQHQIVPPKELQDEYFKLIKNKKPQLVDKSAIFNSNKQFFAQLTNWYENPIPKHNLLRKERRVTRQQRTNTQNQRSENTDYVEIEDDMELEDMETTTNELILIDDIVEEEEEEEISNGFQSNEAILLAAQNRVSNLQNVNKNIELEEVDFDIDNSTSPRHKKAKIKLLSWKPNSKIIKEMDGKSKEEILTIYFKNKSENKNRPSYFIQVADFLFKKKMKKEAARILSNCLELDLENIELIKLVARKFFDENELSKAIELYKELKVLRPEEPQSYRDLALAYEKNKQYQKALQEYALILEKKWGRFEQIKPIILNEINCLISKHKSELDLNLIPSEFIKPMPLDIRVVMDWSSNDNDIDLWVVDPNGEKCYYQHTRTRIGGKISRDFTAGFGPEEFSLKQAKRGFYTIYAHYFRENRQKITGPITVYLNLYTNYGRKNEQLQTICVQLENDNKTQQIGQIQF